jgi:hypothetical protein
MIRPSVHVATRDASHPFVFTHPTIEGISDILQGNAKGKGKSRQGDQGPGIVLQHALRWAIEKSDIQVITWLCGLDGEWVSSDKSGG